MAKPDLGKKLTCPSCGAKFYDLHKSPAICPKCETTVEAQPLLKPKRTPGDDTKAKAKAPPPAKDADEDAIIGDDDEDIELDDEDDDLIEDTSDLEEEDDEMSEVKEHIDGEEER